MLLASWDGEAAVIRHDAESSAWIFVCLHSIRLGPAGGGTRMSVYRSPGLALADAMRLASAMTRKLAIAGLPFGGGKAVIAVPSLPLGAERRALLLRYGELVESLGGTYRTSSDMNTNAADMDVIGERTRYVFGRSTAAGGSGDPALPTAVGVVHGIRASLAHAFGSESLEGRSVVVQGAGGVGAALAAHLTAAGAVVAVADVDGARAREIAARVGAAAIPAEEAMTSTCDVFAPCAVGGILSRDTVRRLRCRVVAGSANNQLADEEAADGMRSRGILYAPDYVINGGGSLALVGLEQLAWSEAELDVALEGIAATLREVFHRAGTSGTSTAAAADALADERIRGGIEASADPASGSGQLRECRA